MPFKIVRNDITHVKADVIVNTANLSPIYVSGTDLAVYQAAGADELLSERKKVGCIKCGDIAVTGAYALNAKYIIHTVGPKYPTENCQLNLAKCYIESLNLAKKNEIHSITFPSISTGKFSYPKKEACHIAVQTIKGWLKENCDYSMKVVFACVDPTIYELIYSELNDAEKE